MIYISFQKKTEKKLYQKTNRDLLKRAYINNLYKLYINKRQPEKGLFGKYK